MDIGRLRTPVLWTSCILGGILFLHLIGIYIYTGGSTIGVSGGSISIGMVGESPGVPNPLKYGQNKQTDLILKFLFRSLLHYSDTTSEYRGDIANCDIADLSKVTCTLNEGIWSDGTKIQVDDVIATIQAFRSSPPNEKMQAFLGNVSVVSKKANTIEIAAKEKSSLMLDLLTYPILRSDMIERIRTGRLSHEAYITSGAYTFLENEKNAQYGYDKVTLEKSTKISGEGWLDKYHFLFFPDRASLERSTENLNIIIPPVKQEKMLLGPRFDSYEYTFLEYLGFFLNTDTVSPEIRKHTILQMRSSLSGAVVKSEKPLQYLFSSGAKTTIKLDKNFTDVLSSKGYQKIDERLAKLEKETGVLTGSSVVYESNTFIDTPSKKKIDFSEAAEGVITISGRVPGGTKNVIINGYTLKEFLPENSRFTYKVSREAGTLIEGKNIYTLEFETFTGTRTVKDIFTLYYSRSPESLAEARKAVESEYLAKLNSAENIAKRMEKVTSQKNALKALDPRYYYDDNLRPLEFEIVSLSEPTSLTTYAEKISQALANLSIKTKLTPISNKDLLEMLKKGAKNYNGIVVGFEANGNFSRIAQIFLSSEAKNGINFAKIESKNLDGLLASFRVASTKEQSQELREKIENFIASEAFFFPISSPLHTFYIDKNLKQIETVPTFQDLTSLYNVLKKASIKEEYILKFEGKGVSDFFHWLWKAANTL